MLYDVMLHIRNFFPTDVSEDGEYIIEDGTISLPFIPNGAYFRIENSIFNDGVYKYPLTSLTDETFKGTITLLAPPKSFLKLVDDIEAFESKNSLTDGAFTSESFGGYSYSRATNSVGGLAGWQDVYRTKLNAWRKI